MKNNSMKTIALFVAALLMLCGCPRYGDSDAQLHYDELQLINQTIVQKIADKDTIAVRLLKIERDSLQRLLYGGKH